MARSIGFNKRSHDERDICKLLNYVWTHGRVVNGNAKIKMIDGRVIHYGRNKNETIDLRNDSFECTHLKRIGNRRIDIYVPKNDYPGAVVVRWHSEV